MNRLSETDTSPHDRPCNSQTLEPGTLATYESSHSEEAAYDEAWTQSLCPHPEIAVRRLPVEIWTAVCEALRQLDSIDSIKMRGLGLEAQYATTNANRPDPIFTAHSILPLSQTCRYLHKVTSASFMKYIRVCPPRSIQPRVWSSRLAIGQIRSFRLNSDQRLQLVRGLAIDVLSRFAPDSAEPFDEAELRSEIHGLLLRLPNLRHLTVVGIALDAPLMRNITRLPLEHLGLRTFRLDTPTTYLILTPRTERRIKLRSLVAYDCSQGNGHSVFANWMSQLVGSTMQDLTLDGVFLNPLDLPVLPDLEFLRIPNTLRAHQMSPSLLSSLLSGSPNLKEAALELKAASGLPSSTFPDLPHLQHITCHSSWLRYLVPGRPIIKAKVICDPLVRVEQVCEILSESSVSLRDLSLTYTGVMPGRVWSPGDLKAVVRFLPELETLRLAGSLAKVASLQPALVYVSRLDRLRRISFSFQVSMNDRDILDHAWQELKLREFLGLTKSPNFERIAFCGEGEWKWEKPGGWNLWAAGKIVRSVTL